MNNKVVLSNSVQIQFPVFSRTETSTFEAKVDTGATMSSLHGTDVEMSGSTVSFTNDVLSPNKRISMYLVGTQDVVSADSEGVERPIVKMPIAIRGTDTEGKATVVSLDGVEFNISDRSNMDVPILLGQNILQSGNFVVDPNQEQDDDQTFGRNELRTENVQADINTQHATMEQTRDAEIRELVKRLKEMDVSLKEFMDAANLI